MGQQCTSRENISATSLDKNREMGLNLTDPAVVSAVEQAFAGDFGGAPSPVSQPDGHLQGPGQREPEPDTLQFGCDAHRHHHSRLKLHSKGRLLDWQRAVILQWLRSDCADVGLCVLVVA
jgi:hypothetical protein